MDLDPPCAERCEIPEPLVWPNDLIWMAWQIINVTCRDALVGNLVASEVVLLLRDVYGVKQTDLNRYLMAIFQMEAIRLEYVKTEEEEKELP